MHNYIKIDASYFTVCVDIAVKFYCFGNSGEFVDVVATVYMYLCICSYICVAI